MMTRALLACLLVLMIPACSSRGQLDFFSPAPDAPASSGQATERPIMVATTRGIGGQRLAFSAVRSAAMGFGEVTISIPPTHVEGQIEWPGNDEIDPDRHFVTKKIERFGSERTFGARVLERTRALKPRSDRVIIFVHGYNANFPEALYRFAQMHYDFGVNAVPILFSWPSASNAFDYLYDRDSALYSRRGLADLIALLQNNGVSEIEIVAHSMGAFLTMETLRQMALQKGSGAFRRITSIVLLSPDISVDVFQAQARDIGPLPQPFTIISSTRDRALAASARLAGRTERLGQVGSAQILADLNVTLIDTSAFADGSGFNHMTVATSPELIDTLTKLGQANTLLDSDSGANSGVIPGTIELFQQATQIVLNPN